MTIWTATHRDLWLGGLSPSACVPDALAVASVLLSGSVFEVPGHGFTGGEPTRYASSNGAIPAPLNGRVYYTVAATDGDPDFYTLEGVTLTDIGSGDIVVKENVIPKIDVIMSRWTSYLIANAIAYSAPWTTPPGWAPRLVAHLAAPDVAQMLRIAPARYDVTEVTRRAKDAEATIADLSRGAVLNDGTGPIDANDVPDDAMLATNSVVGGHVVAMPWVTGVM